MPKYIIGWSFDYSTPEEHWCDKSSIQASNQQSACSYYTNQNRVVADNPVAVLHVKEVKHDN